MAADATQDARAKPLPQVFIGSSSDALPLARRIQEKLESGGTIAATVWDQDIFELSGNVLDDLLRYVSLFDFAALVLSADDLTSSRGRRMASPRDNVIFELGLFMGVRGRRRAFAIIAPKKSVAGRAAPTIKLPSDLDGNTALRLDPEKLDDDTYLTEQIGKVRAMIEKRSLEAALLLLPSAALAFGYFYNFLVPVCDYLSGIGQVMIDGASRAFVEGSFEFTILVPSTLADAAITGRDACIRRKGLLPYSFSKERRTYGFFIYPPRQDEPVRFADYPTTLRSSLDVMDLAFREEALGQYADVKKLMGQREISNFVKAVDILLEKPEASGFRGKVRFDYVA